MAASYPQVVLLGDSLFQHSIELRNGFSFFAAVATGLNRRMDVVNRGFSGWNTNNILQHLDSIFPEPSPSVPKIAYLAVLIGANDAVLPHSVTKQHVPIDLYKENLIKMIKHPRIQAHNPKILLVTPPPVDELKHTALDMEKGWSQTIRRSAISASYSEKVREVAHEDPGVVLIDLWQAIMDRAIEMAPGDFQPQGPWLGTVENGKAGGLDDLLPDGLHMSGDAYRVFFDTIRPHLDWEFPLDEERFVFPSWRVLNEVAN